MQETPRLQWPVPEWTADWQAWQQHFTDLVNGQDSDVFGTIEGMKTVYSQIPNARVFDDGGTIKFEITSPVIVVSRTLNVPVSVALDDPLTLLPNYFIGATITPGAVEAQVTEFEMFSSVPKDPSVQIFGYVTDAYAINWYNGATLSLGDPFRPIFSFFAGSGTDTERVKVSLDDTTAGYLSDKIVAGAGTVLNVLNPGANESIEIVAASSWVRTSGSPGFLVPAVATDTIRVGAGTAAQPGVSSWSDPDTGLVWAGSGELDVSIDGTNEMRFLRSGSSFVVETVDPQNSNYVWAFKHEKTSSGAPAWVQWYVTGTSSTGGAGHFTYVTGDSTPAQYEVTVSGGIPTISMEAVSPTGGSATVNIKSNTTGASGGSSISVLESLCTGPTSSLTKIYSKNTIRNATVNVLAETSGGEASSGAVVEVHAESNGTVNDPATVRLHSHSADGDALTEVYALTDSVTPGDESVVDIFSQVVGAGSTVASRVDIHASHDSGTAYVNIGDDNTSFVQFSDSMRGSSSFPSSYIGLAGSISDWDDFYSLTGATSILGGIVASYSPWTRVTGTPNYLIPDNGDDHVVLGSYAGNHLDIYYDSSGTRGILSNTGGSFVIKNNSSDGLFIEARDQSISSDFTVCSFTSVSHQGYQVFPEPAYIRSYTSEAQATLNLSAQAALAPANVALHAQSSGTGDAWVEVYASATGTGASEVRIGSTGTDSVFLIDGNMVTAGWSVTGVLFSGAGSEWTDYATNFSETTSLLAAINSCYGGGGLWTRTTGTPVYISPSNVGDYIRVGDVSGGDYASFYYDAGTSQGILEGMTNMTIGTTEQSDPMEAKLQSIGTDQSCTVTAYALSQNESASATLYSRTNADSGGHDSVTTVRAQAAGTDVSSNAIVKIYATSSNGSSKVIVGDQLTDEIQMVTASGVAGVSISSQPNFTAEAVLHVGQDLNDPTEGFIIDRYEAYSLTDPPKMLFRRSASDTFGSHTALTNAHQIGKIQFYGSDGTAWGLGAQMSVVPTETWSGSQRGTGVAFSFVRDGTTSSPVGLLLSTDLVQLGSSADIAEVSIESTTDILLASPVAIASDSIIIGNDTGHTITGAYSDSLLGGDSLSFSGTVSDSVIVVNSASFAGVSSSIIGGSGHAAVASISDSSVIGSAFDIDQAIVSSGVFGYNHTFNTSGSSYVLVSGSTNIIQGANFAVAAGDHNTISGDNGLTIGSTNTNDTDFSVVSGYSAKSLWNNGVYSTSSPLDTGVGSNQTFYGQTVMRKFTGTSTFPLTEDGTGDSPFVLEPDRLYTVKFLMHATWDGTYYKGYAAQELLLVCWLDSSGDVQYDAFFDTAKTDGSVPGTFSVGVNNAIPCIRIRFAPNAGCDSSYPVYAYAVIQSGIVTNSNIDYAA